jgi:hypothetical protein
LDCWIRIKESPIEISSPPTGVDYKQIFLLYIKYRTQLFKSCKKFIIGWRKNMYAIFCGLLKHHSAKISIFFC